MCGLSAPIVVDYNSSRDNQIAKIISRNTLTSWYITRVVFTGIKIVLPF
jgi:hypothetical protein